ncbi:MAG: hypothetical protein HGA27_00240 [Peptococcaceae bacterium]|nr:hypothetical protein [Peptococcaceae bacterium]
MAYNTKNILRDLGNVPITQGFDPENDNFAPLTVTELDNGRFAQDSLVTSMQKKWRDTFAGPSTLDAAKWDIVQTGTNQSITVATPGELSLITGTDINQETIIRSKEVFTVSYRLMFASLLSQRITNQEFYVEMISVDPVTLLPDGKHRAGWKYDGATATQAKYLVQNSGLTELLSAASTIPTTVSYSCEEIEIFPDEAWFHARAIDSTSGRSSSYVRHQSIPDANALYKIQLRFKNLAVAPASTTTWKFQFVNMVDFIELTTEITASRGAQVSGMGMPVNVTNTAAIPIQGQNNHDSVIASAPVRVAGRAVTADYTSVATGDTADIITTVKGIQIVQLNSIPENMQSVTPAVITGTTDTQLFAAAGTGIRNYLTDLQLHNTNAVATEVQIKDGSTVIWKGYLPASMPSPQIYNFQTALKGSANAIMYVACVTNAANVYVNAQGYKHP